MIIPALVRLYDRLLEEGGEELAPPGYSRQQIGFKVVLERDGTLFDIVEMVDVSAESTKPGKQSTPKRRAQRLLVPGQSKPPGRGINPCFLWDNPAYMLGLPQNDHDPAWAAARFEAFRDRHLALRDELRDSGFDAVCAFLQSWKPDYAMKRKGLAEIVANFGVFQVRAEQALVHDRPRIASWWKSRGVAGVENAEATEGPGGIGPSLVDGRPKALARLHEPKIKNVSGAQPSGATVVSFNQPSFASYAKEQGANAPVGVDDAFKYCTALNRLTADEHRRVRLAGDTIVFWSEGSPAAENAVAAFLGAPPGDPEASIRARHLFQRACQGLPDDEFGRATTPFFILGLAPNMARVSVRLWSQSTAGEIARRLSQHAADLTMAPAPEDSDAPSIGRIVAETVMPSSKPGFPDTDRIQPGLSASVLRAVLTGGPFPRSLLAAIVTRCRVEGLADASTRKDWRQAQHRRCAIIRACLLRDARAHGSDKEIPMSFDPSSTRVGYQLGRLFAILERCQEDAKRCQENAKRCQENAIGSNVNSTIKDRYFGSAMTTPAVILPRLLKLNAHHLHSIGAAGQRVVREKELGEVMSAIASFPRTLRLEDQGLFAIGYYHQRQTYFTKKDEQPVA